MGKEWKQWLTFILGASKITADAECSHEIKRCLLLGRKVMTNLHSILKSRNITLSTKVHLVKAMVFPVVMFGCESRTTKKAELRRIDAFELWSRRRLLRVPWTARRCNEFILKEISLDVHWKDWCSSWNCNSLAIWCETLTPSKRPWEAAISSSSSSYSASSLGMLCHKLTSASWENTFKIIHAVV